MAVKKVLGIEISNPEKIVFPKSNLSKLDVINYYKMVAKFMLPYVKNRQLSAIRCHKTIEDECFFKKHPNTKNKYIHTYIDGEHEYFYVKTKEDLIYQAQLGTLEFHTQGANVSSPNKPNYMVFDLDPDTKISISQLRQGVLDLKSILDQLDLISFLKTSGGKGYHIVVPFKSCKNWDKFYNFARQIATLMEAKWPKLYTTNMRKTKRKGKIFIDYLRNDKGATCVAPYSLRARQNAPVSMPIDWKDLSKIEPSQIIMQNIKTRLSKKDPWENFFEINQSIK